MVFDTPLKFDSLSKTYFAKCNLYLFGISLVEYILSKKFGLANSTKAFVLVPPPFSNQPGEIKIQISDPLFILCVAKSSINMGKF